MLRSEVAAKAIADGQESDAARPTPAAGTDWREEAIRQIAVRKALVAEGSTTVVEPAAVAAETAVILVEQMAARLGWNALTVSEDDVRRQYDAHPEQYNDPEKLRLQHIFLRAEADELTAQERSAVRAKLEDVRRQLVDGADFTAMARQYSESSTAQSGGWMTLKRGAAVAPAFVEAAWDLELNQVSEVVDTPNGFHVLVARERFPPLARRFEEVREFARKRALTAKRDQAEAEFLREVGPRYGLVRDYEPLNDPLAAPDTALIRWDDGHFTVADLRAQLPAAYLEHLSNHYFPKVHEFLDQVALNRLLLAEAHRLELDQTDEVKRLVAGVMADRAAEAGLEQRVQARIARVPERELRAYYDQNQKRYQTLRTYDLSVILLPPGDNLWQALKRGERLVERIRAGEDFEQLARANSMHFTAGNGGRLSAIDDHALARLVQSTAKFRRALSNLAVGETAPAMVAECYDPDRLRFVPTGVLVFRKDAETPPEQVSYDDAELFVRDNYLRRNYQRLVEEVRTELLDEIHLRILSDRLPPL